jgi:hypothetical protein
MSTDAHGKRLTAGRVKFLMIEDATSGGASAAIPGIVFVLNWTEELKARAGSR